jgi:hypothetical protein
VRVSSNNCIITLTKQAGAPTARLAVCAERTRVLPRRGGGFGVCSLRGVSTGGLNRTLSHPHSWLLRTVCVCVCARVCACTRLLQYDCPRTESLRLMRPFPFPLHTPHPTGDVIAWASSVS